MSAAATYVCRQFVEDVTAYLDGALSDEVMTLVDNHLADCPHCSEYLAQLRVTIDALGHVDIDELSDDALDDLVTLYGRWRAG